MSPADLARAIDLALGGRWDEAHRIVQEDEADPQAAWVHAVLHKLEGDAANARYWYGRAGRIECVDHDPGVELRSIRDMLAG